MAERGKCIKCNGDTNRDYPHCPPCMRALLAAGLCKWCGKEPRKPAWKKLSDYCLACTIAAVEALKNKDVLPATPTTKYRDGGARENTWETKHG